MAKKKTSVASQGNFGIIGGLVKDLNSHYGKNIMKTGENIPKIYKVPFDEPALDDVSDGGIAIGRFTEFLGKEHSGKTRNALRSMYKFQKYCFGCMTPNVLDATWEVDKDGTPYTTDISCSNCKKPETRVNLMVDIEGTTDPKFMSVFGIQVNGVVYVRPDMPSQAVGIVDAFLRNPLAGLILVDSVGSMGSDSEVEKAIEDIKMNQNALFLNKAIRKWQMALNSNTNETGKENGTTMIVINQSYDSIGLFSKEIAQGGRGLRHGKAMSLKTRVKEKNKDPKSGDTLGIHVVYENLKNKTGIPYRKREYYLNLDPRDPDIKYCHTNVALQYVDIGVGLGIIDQKGGWFEFEGTKYQGKLNLIEAFNDDMKKAIDDKLKEA